MPDDSLEEVRAEMEKRLRESLRDFSGTVPEMTAIAREIARLRTSDDGDVLADMRRLLALGRELGKSDADVAADLLRVARGAR